MKLGDIQYLKLVDKLMGHKHFQLTESECTQEIAAVTDGAVSSFAEGILPGTTSEQLMNNGLQGYVTPKKRGRPVGSKNKPKPPKGS